MHGVQLAARYLPGTVGVDVGGDWYDAIQLEDGGIGLVVGDVVGKGVQAAAMMGQLRNALRAFAFEHNDPHEVVSRLGRLVDGMMEVPFATLAYLVVDPRERACGTSWPAIRRRSSVPRTARPRSSNGGRTLPIGVDGSLTVSRRRGSALEEGSTIVLYTDGLVERRGRSLDEGLRLLADAAAVSDDDPEELVDAIVDSLIGDNERPDDVAVLALRFTVAVVDELDLVVPATKDGLVEMRAMLSSLVIRGQSGGGRSGRDRPRPLGGGRERHRARATSRPIDRCSTRDARRRRMAAGRGRGQRQLEAE